MTTDSDRLARMERRQEVVIQAMSTLADTVRLTNAMLAELMEWLKKPPSNELSDALAKLAAEVDALRGAIAVLPEAVIRGLRGGAI